MDAMCLSIAENSIIVEADGTLSLLPMRLGAGAKGKATYQRRDVAAFFKGATARIRSDQADAVRDCMQPHIARVLGMLSGNPIPPVAERRTNISDNTINSGNTNIRGSNNITVGNNFSGNNNTIGSNNNSGNVSNSGNISHSGNTTQIITNNFAAPTPQSVAAIPRNFFVMPVELPDSLAVKFGTMEQRNLRDIIGLALRTVPNSRISSKNAPLETDDRIYSAIVKFKENRVKNPQFEGAQIAKGLFGKLGAQLT